MNIGSRRRRLAFEEAAVYGALTAVGAFVFVTAFGYGLLTDGGRVGPGLLPAVVGGMVALIAGGRLLAVVRERRTADDPHPAERGRADARTDDDVDIFGRTARMRARQLRIVFAALTVAVLAVPLLGLLGAFFALSLFLSAVVERRPWPASALISVVSIVILYVIFVEFLRIPLPVGLIGIGG